MNKCKTCKNWIAPPKKGNVWGDCEEIKNSALSAFYAVPPDTDTDIDVEGDICADFGCVLWEEKE